MCLPIVSACFFFFCSRQRLRFSFTSRIPTVIWVGRSDRIGIGWIIGSRAFDMTGHLPPGLLNMQLWFVRLWHDVTCDQSPLATPRTGKDVLNGCEMAANHRHATTIVDKLATTGRPICRETL